ncbi:MAG: hypothetical protein M9924_08670 [Rhizobiaceae bacterium]|nr:hypothetical protein [Rhizobiaceae bacterium]
MTLVDLILTVCLTANPTSCRDEHLLFESRGSLMRCMWQAPIQIAQWSQEHPTVKVVRWKCAFPDGGRDI